MVGSNKIKHIGLIIDGNRRYAKSRDISYDEAYNLGAQKVDEIIKFIFSKTEVLEISIYMLSRDNLFRDRKELETILNAEERLFDSWSADKFFVNGNIHVRFVGELNLLPVRFQRCCDNLKNKTSKNNSKILNLLVAYKGNAEVCEAVERSIKEIYRIINKFEVSVNSSQSLNTALIEVINNNLEIQTPVDLIIRTANENRLSGFLPWQSEYAELYSINKFWPEITNNDITEAINSLAKKERKHGL